MNLSDMTRDERSLLLYFESCSVDYSGRINGARINKEDFEIAKRWNDSGFIGFGRIIVNDHNSQGGNWVELSDEAWNIAHQERRARYARNKPRYTRTCNNG